MKKIVFLVMTVCLLAACKKDRDGKHCPLITNMETGHQVDLAPVAWIPQIMDTLAKYPQLQVYRVRFNPSLVDPTQYSANIFCHVFYKGLIIFDRDYFLYASTYGREMDSAMNRSKIPADIHMDPEPLISIEKANTIAKKKIRYEHCTVSRLGFLNMGTDSISDYKLTWRIRDTEFGYRWVDVDARTGSVLYFTDDIILY